MMKTQRATAWIRRWNDTIASEPDLPGVWRRREGGFRVRGRVVDPKSRKLREVNRALPDCKRARDAAGELAAELERIRIGTACEDRPFSTFTEYALELFERKIRTGKIASAAGREKWSTILEKHLIPYFGSWYLDKITKRDIEAWKVSLVGYAPSTCNTMLAVLKTIMAAASEDYEGLIDPAAKIDPFETKTHRTYTSEEPNSLKLEDVEPFLNEMRVRWPEHYAMVYLGMWTGWRPSMLRPLRRRGPDADINWESGELIARRSHTLGDETMVGTKNGDDQHVKLPAEVIEVLRWHCARLDDENKKRARRYPENAQAMAASNLLFPAEPNGRNRGGGFRTRSSLNKAFADVAKAIGLPYDVTPRALRRSFQDLARSAAVSDVVTRAVCGHRTPEMTARYSTVRLDEQQAALGKIISLAAARARRDITTSITNSITT